MEAWGKWGVQKAGKIWWTCWEREKEIVDVYLNTAAFYSKVKELGTTTINLFLEV